MDNYKSHNGFIICMDYIVVKYFKYGGNGNVIEMTVGKIISSIKYDINVLNQWVKNGWIKIYEA
jgi:hypothetical protein